MNDKELTDWFPPSIKPVHAGVYFLRHSVYKTTPFPWYYWNGSYWTSECSDHLDDFCFVYPTNSKSIYAVKCEWRGLANKP